MPRRVPEQGSCNCNMIAAGFACVAKTDRGACSVTGASIYKPQTTDIRQQESDFDLESFIVTPCRKANLQSYLVRPNATAPMRRPAFGLAHQPVLLPV